MGASPFWGIDWAYKAQNRCLLWPAVLHGERKPKRKRVDAPFLLKQYVIISSLSSASDGKRIMLMQKITFVV
jgi:hypothetical protein